ncbi:MAG: zinc ribbon domain-containing protein [Candidatus Omnitrophota bacterium]|jgi:hypothetical protein
MGDDNQDYFDFTSEQELPEEDSPKMRPCPNCAQPIPTNCLFCLYCGQPVSQYKKNRWVALVAILVLVAFIFLIFIR